jgi:hypothetical protein
LWLDCAAWDLAGIFKIELSVFPVMSQRTSVALFLATSALIGTASAPLSQAANSTQFPAPRSPQQLAQATECVPIGEGENCARDRNRSKQPAAAPTRSERTTPGTGTGAAGPSAPKVQN